MDLEGSLVIQMQLSSFHDDKFFFELCMIPYGQALNQQTMEGKWLINREYKKKKCVTLSEDVPSIFGLLSFQLVIPKRNLKSIIIDDKESDKTIKN